MTHRLYSSPELPLSVPGPWQRPRDYVSAHAIHPLIRNVHTRLFALETENQLFPMTVDDGGILNNSYVVSPLSAYTGYALEELHKIESRASRIGLEVLIRAVQGPLATYRIDRLVQMNNWMLSTNLYPPDYRGTELVSLTRMLTERFADHAICFRSLNRHTNATLMRRLEEAGYDLVPSRQLYLFDGSEGDASTYLRKHNVRLDSTLSRKSEYTLCRRDQWNQAELDRMADLYWQLYVEKYCHLNPQFTAEWIAAGHRDGWLEVYALQDRSGRIDGVLGLFSHAEIMTAPLVGYDTKLSQKLGLYRLLTFACLRLAAERRCLLNFSSGASHFKRLRGGVPEIEYSAIYTRHLPGGRQRVYKLLGVVLDRIGVPVMQHFKL